MASVSSLRQKFANVNLAGKNAVCVGATAGIGRAISKLLASRGASVTVIGRSVERGEQVLEELRAAGKGDHRFISMDASLVSSANALGEEWRDKTLDLLFFTQSIATLEGRKETSEGLDLKLALHYYARVAFTEALMPALERSEDARVMFILSAGAHSPYAQYATDPELKDNYGMKTSADHPGFYTDIAMESLGTEHPRVLFVHAVPGFVATTWGSEFNAVLRGVVRFMQLFATSADDCATYMCSAMLGERPTESSWFLMDQKGRPAQKTALHDEAREQVWQHTKDVLKRLS